MGALDWKWGVGSGKTFHLNIDLNDQRELWTELEEEISRQKQVQRLLRLE